MECLDPGMARARSGCCSCAGARVCVCASTDGVHECMSDHGVHETVGMVCVGACVCGAWGGVSWSLVGKETTPSAWHPQIGVGLNTMPPRCAGNLGLDVKGVYMCQWDQKKKGDTQTDVHNELN